MLIEKGRVISQRYELIRFIGRGGMSEVWKARHIHLDKLVAIKFMNRELMDKKEFVQRFKQEAKIASNLMHKNICTVTDFGFTEENIAYLVMEYLEGESVGNVLKRLERLPVGASLSILKQALEGLSIAHQSGVVHRDIKPANLFISKKKNGERVIKILDFGISKIVRGGKDEMQLTSTGTLLGTAFYLSPEQIMESRGVDHRTDIYAMGAVLYKMVTGKVPFIGDNFGEVAVKVVNDPLLDPRNIVTDLSSSVVKIIKKAMEKDPRGRYQSAQQMVEDVGRVLEDFHGDTIDSLYKPGIENLLLKSVEKKKKLLIPDRKLKIAVISASFAVVLALVFGVIFGFNRSSKGKVLEGSSRVQTAANSSAKAEVKKVSIRFNSLPPGARIRIGEEEFGGETVRVKKSQVPLKVKILAEGYLPKEIEILPSRNLEVDGSLQPLIVEGEKPAGEEVPDETTSEEEEKTGEKFTPIRRKAKKKRGGGMDFMREFTPE